MTTNATKPSRHPRRPVHRPAPFLLRLTSPFARTPTPIILGEAPQSRFQPSEIHSIPVIGEDFSLIATHRAPDRSPKYP